jgi:hypothetical protein
MLPARTALRTLAALVTCLLLGAAGLAPPAAAQTIPTSVTVTATASTVSFRTPDTLTATVTPPTATGTVTFLDLLSTGPQAGQNVILAKAALTAGIASVTVDLAAFNTNTITASYGGDSADIPSVSSPTNVQVTGYRGEVLINQFRLSGPDGAADQYAELFNVGRAVSLGGFTLSSSSGTSVTIPECAPVLPTNGTYLIVGGSYSLSSVAPGDLSTPSLGSDGLKVTAPDAAGTTTDSVGSTAAQSGYYSGTPLPALSGTPTDQYAWLRLETGAEPVNTNNNAADFQLVSTTGGAIGGVQSTLGSPSPLESGSSGQVTLSNGLVPSTLLDPTQAATASPNFVYQAGSPGVLTIRRTLTNDTGCTVSSAEIRITSLSEANGAPEPGVTTQPTNPAQLRVIDPTTPTSQVTLSSGQVVTVQNLSVDPPASASPGGGLGSTLTVPVDGGLAPGGTINIALTFAVDQGGRYWFGYDLDALSTAAGATSGPDAHGTKGARAKRPPAGQSARYAGGSGVIR